MTGKCVFDFKKKPDTNIIARRAHCVICGDHELPGLGFNDLIFARHWHECNSTIVLPSRYVRVIISNLSSYISFQRIQTQ